MSYKVTLRQVKVSLKFAEDRPKFRAHYSAKPAEWFYLTARANLPIIPEDVRVEGRGLYIKKDGTTGNQSADMSFGHLVTVPEPYKSQILAELQAVAR